MDEFIVEGVKTLLPLQRELIDGPVFREVRMHTRYVDEFIKARDA